MKRQLKILIPVALLCTLFAALTTLSAQTPAAPKPGPEHAKMGMWVGKWQFEGQAHASPYGPAGKITTVESFEMLPGGFFMTHHWDVKQGDVVIKGMEVWAYDSATKTYTTRFYDNFGNTGTWKGTVKGDTWSWTAESVVGGKPIKERGTNVVSGEVVTSKFEFSTDGKTWLPNFEVKGRRVK